MSRVEKETSGDATSEEMTPAKILVIEDDTDDQALLLHQLHKSGVNEQIMCVEDGNDALDLVRHGARKLSAVCAVFLDLSLPGVNGLLLLQAIRSNVENGVATRVHYDGQHESQR